MTTLDASRMPDEEREIEASSPDVVVDIGITAYKRATFVRDAIDSVLAQTFDRWLLTIYENGPGGGEIEDAVRPYLSDPRVSFQPSERQLPFADNWTRAIRAGSGRYVALLHDDDRWHDDFLRRRVEALDANPECGFAYSEWVQIDEHGNEISRSPIRSADGALEQGDLARQLVERNPIGGSTTLVRRSAYEAVGFAFDGRWFYCDWEMWARLVARYPAYYVARQDNDFRRHASANSFVSPEDPERLLAMMDHVERVLTEGVGDFDLSRVDRARTRSIILLQAASAAHRGGGWKDAATLYRRALRQYPPTVFTRMSLSMLARSLLGRRGSRAIAHAMHVAARGRP